MGDPPKPAPDQFKVCLNAEEQYSLWPADIKLPQGWLPAGFAGDHPACLDFIAQVFTDLRPLSLRRDLGD
jgi:MbtH protein